MSKTEFEVILRGVERPSSLHPTAFISAVNALNKKCSDAGAFKKTETIVTGGKRPHTLELEWCRAGGIKAFVTVLSIKENVVEDIAPSAPQPTGEGENEAE